MAVTSLADINNSLRPVLVFDKQSTNKSNAKGFLSLWYNTGTSGAGLFDITTANGVVQNSSVNWITGQMPFWNAQASANNYIAKFTTAVNDSSGSGYMILLCDRLWQGGANTTGIAIDPTSTSIQNINSAPFPPRDDNGTANGVGVIIGLEVANTMGAGTPNITMTYTNSSGVAGRTSNTMIAGLNGAQNGTFIMFATQGSDVGVQSIQSIQQDATWTSGNYVLVAFRVITAIFNPLAGGSYSGDAISMGLPKMWNGSVPFIVLMSAVSSGGTGISSSITYSQV